MNVYHIHQDTEHLYGDYLVTAVVVAKSVDDAISAIKRYLANESKLSGDDILCETSRLSVEKVGNNGKVPATWGKSVLCVMLGEDHDRPPGIWE